ncbi:MAG TPA: YciI family protein [Planctomycetota bacterium]|jgi:uncharacterized protein YciI|nr:hypothetical protein [Planctomycetota bacterium]HJM39048.1 YciI family protein [Planctomycetota bacterium]|tara:strand:- start:17637 stop:17942 length:306 start_codon:yes stop_codon:yes gene_type:complete
MIENTDLRYVILLTAEEGVEVNEELVRAHVAHLKQLEARGDLEFCGPFTDGTGGLAIIRAVSYEAACAIAEADPFVASGARTCDVGELEKSHAGNNYLGMG